MVATLKVLWRAKWWIFGAPLLVAALTALIVMRMPNVYSADALLAPAEDVNSGMLSSLVSQFGGLASVVGVGMGKGKADKVTIGVEVLKSRAFIGDFIQRRNILVELMAAKSWNARTGELKIDADKYDENAREWLADEDNLKKIPSEWKAYKTFSGIMQVSQAKSTGLVTLSIKHVSPQIAKQWIEWLVEDVNQQMRLRDIQDAQKSIDYLSEQLKQTAVSGMQQVLYELIEKQLQIMMLANVRDQYVFRVIDPPVVAEEKVSPKRALIVVFVFMGALFVSVFVVLVVDAFNVARQKNL